MQHAMSQLALLSAMWRMCGGCGVSSCYDIINHSPSAIIYTSKEPVCPRVELILKIIIILLIIFLGFIKSKPC